MSKREEVTDFIVKHIDSIIPGNKFNGELIRKKLESLTKAEFAQYMDGLKPRTELKEGETKTTIPFYLPNLTKDKVSIARMFKLVRGLGRSLSHRLIMTDPKTGVQYLTPHEYPCMDIMVRRQAQTSYKKASIPGAKQALDDLTGQPTALAKGSRISSPELKFLDSRGLENVQSELVHVRGGAKSAYREFTRQLFTEGEVNIDELKGLGYAKSTETLAALMNGQHLGNNVLPNTKVPDEALPDKLRN